MPQTNKAKNFVKKSVYIRDKYKCRYCGVSTTLKDKNSHRARTVDHLIPRTLGGRSNFVNLVTACKRCNERKGHQSVKAAGMTLRPTPKHSEDEMHAWFARVYLNRCVNCGRTSKKSHGPAPYHGGPKRCLTQDSYYMSRNHYEYLKSIGELDV